MVMQDDRQYEEEDKEATKEFIPDEDEIGDDEEELDYEPECEIASSGETDLECEFEVKDGAWWCNSHDCWA